MLDESPVPKTGVSTETFFLIALSVGLTAYALRYAAMKAGEQEAKKQVNEKIDELKEAVGLKG